MIEKSKQKYVKPHMEVYELKHRARLLVGSSGDAGLQDYNWNNVPEE